jgi:hypothetical protein
MNNEYDYDIEADNDDNDDTENAAFGDAPNSGNKRRRTGCILIQNEIREKVMFQTYTNRPTEATLKQGDFSGRSLRAQYQTYCDPPPPKNRRATSDG